MNPEQALIVQQVQSIAAENVSAEDFQQQVDRWNRYHASLDVIQRQCEIEGARFRRRLKTSYSERRERNILQGFAVAMITASIYISIMGYFAINNYGYNIYEPRTWDRDMWVWAGDIAWWGALMGVLVASQAIRLIWNRGPLPEKIKFECKPVIFIDDLYYLRRAVRQMAKEGHDPKIVLPTLTMELSQSWIKQNSLLAIMGTMKDIQIK